jgi:hypothetical protein
MSSPGGSKALAIVVYTLLRIAVFLAVWLTFELLTPINGIWAIVAALLVSGAISLFVLDRQRARVASAAAGFFGGINARIEASARAEDDDDDVPGAAAARPSGDGEQSAEGKAVDQQQ